MTTSNPYNWTRRSLTTKEEHDKWLKHLMNYDQSYLLSNLGVKLSDLLLIGHDKRQEIEKEDKIWYKQPFGYCKERTLDYLYIITNSDFEGLIHGMVKTKYNRKLSELNLDELREVLSVAEQLDNVSNTLTFKQCAEMLKEYGY